MLIVIGVFLVWWLVFTLKLVSPLLVPHPGLVAKSMFALLFSAKTYLEIGATLYRFGAGLFLGIFFGLPLGLSMELFSLVYRAVIFWIDFVRSIPATAFIPWSILIFGVGSNSKIFVIALFSGAYFALSTWYGVKAISPGRLQVATLHGFSLWQKIIHVIIPETIAHTVSGLRSAITVALVICVAAEMFVGTKYGLGKVLINSQITYETATLYAWIIMIGLIGLGINKATLILERRYVHWVGK